MFLNRRQSKQKSLCFIQFNVFTDIASQSQLAAFIRFMNTGEISEELLFCKALQLHANVKIFSSVLLISALNFQLFGIRMLELAPVMQQHAQAHPKVAKRAKDKASNVKCLPDT